MDLRRQLEAIGKAAVAARGSAPTVTQADQIIAGQVAH